MKSLNLFFASLLCSLPALARDSSHLICAGPITARYQIAVQFDEARANGESRIEVLSSVWAGNLYQGSRINTGNGFGENGTVVMAAKNDPRKVFYRGRYNFVRDAESGGYKLQLKGKWNMSPVDSSAPFEFISATLDCSDISN